MPFVKAAAWAFSPDRRRARALHGLAWRRAVFVAAARSILKAKVTDAAWRAVRCLPLHLEDR
jgi:hypothetical protein